jgi:uncharacterized linocin/CFP29 family protein
MTTHTNLSRAATYIEKEWQTPLRSTLVARKLAAKNPNVVGRGVQAVEMTTLSNMSVANIQYGIPSPDVNADELQETVSTVQVPVLYKQFRISRFKIDAYLREGRAFDTAVAQEAVYQVALLEDDYLINGWKQDGSDLKVNGFYNAAGNDYSTAKDFGTFGNAKDAVIGAKLLIELDNALSQSYNLVLNPAQYAELAAQYSATAGWEMDIVKRLLGPQGDVISTPRMADGKGLLMPVDPARKYVEYINPVDFTLIIGEDSRLPGWADYQGTVIDLIYPNVKIPNGLCKLSNI